MIGYEINLITINNYNSIMKTLISIQYFCVNCKMCVKIFKSAKQAVKSQFKLLSTYFDPVFEDSSLDTENVNHQFIIPLLYYLTGFIFGVFGLNPHFRFSDVFSLKYYRTNGYIYYHQFLLQKSWRQSDILFLLNCAFTFLCYFLAALTPPIGRQFRINKSASHKQNCSSPQLARIFQFRNRFRAFIQALSTCYFFYLITFTIKHVLQFGRFTFDGRNVLFWFVYEPVMICYHIFVSLLLLQFATLNVQYLSVRHQFLLRQFSKLHLKLKKSSAATLNKKEHCCSSVQSRNDNDNRIWPAYIALNRRLTVQCSAVAEYARFWAPFVSLYFLANIVKICYELYLIIFYHRYMSRQQLLLFTVYPLYHLLTMGTFIVCCARVEMVNGLILKKCKDFYASFKNGRVICGGQLLKAQLLSNSDRLSPFGFWLFSSTKINFETLFSFPIYIAVFFVLIIDKYQLQQQTK